MCNPAIAILEAYATAWLLAMWLVVQRRSIAGFLLGLVLVPVLAAPLAAFLAPWWFPPYWRNTRFERWQRVPGGFWEACYGW